MPFCSFDSLSLEFRSPIGAIRTGEVLEIRVRVPVSEHPASVRMILLDAHIGNETIIPMLPLCQHGMYKVYSCTFSTPYPSLYFYRFEVHTSAGVRPIRKGSSSQGFYGVAGGGTWQLTVYNSAMQPPASLRQGGIIYQIFPDRYYNSGLQKQNVPTDRLLRTDWGGMPEYSYRPTENRPAASDYFGGDLAGIEEKLDVISALGVTAIYLNPIFEAHSNHRYNTADYLKIDPLLGDEADFRRLCESAAQRGIAIVLDGVFSHTGADSIYFNKTGRYGKGGAYRDAYSPYFDWYDFTHYPDKYHAWWGIEDLPEVREEHEGYLEFICGENGVLQKWLRLGASGFRLDVADELPDVMLDRIHETVKAHDADACIIGEVWEDASNKISYSQRRRYLLGGQLDSVMNYPLANAIKAYVRSGDAAKLFCTLLSLIENYPSPVLHSLMNPLSTHDVPRALTALGAPPIGERDREWQAQNNALSLEQYEQGKQLLKLAAVLQYTLPGNPSLYYGDEAGLYGYADPFNRGCYTWGKEDTELLSFFRRLGNIRLSCPAYKQGRFLPVTFSSELCSFYRVGEGFTAFTAVNRTNLPLKLELCISAANAEIHNLAANGLGSYPQDGILAPFGAVVCIWKGDDLLQAPA